MPGKAKQRRGRRAVPPENKRTERVTLKFTHAVWDQIKTASALDKITDIATWARRSLEVVAENRIHGIQIDVAYDAAAKAARELKQEK